MNNCPDCGAPMLGVDIFEEPISCPDCGRPGKAIIAVFECPACHAVDLLTVPIWPEGVHDYREGVRHDLN
jgi:Zn finger protein HypA/HybF involved in hydrogenase expression